MWNSTTGAVQVLVWHETQQPKAVSYCCATYIPQITRYWYILLSVLLWYWYLVRYVCMYVHQQQVVYKNNPVSST